MTPRTRHRIKWTFITLVLLVVAGLVGGELFARFYLGLGDPPLSMGDATVEYLNKPGEYRRFGNQIYVNRYSMRSPEIDKKKADPRQLRVLVLGDSVVNGGALSDQSELATTLLVPRLEAALKRPVWVGNVSAGSWGPPNLLAYVEKFGWFQADVAVIVISSHDAADVPEPSSGTTDWVQTSPLCGLHELLGRWLPALIGSQDAVAPGLSIASIPAQLKPDDPDVQTGLTALRKLIEHGREHDVRILLAQHWEAQELATGPTSGHHLIAGVAKSLNVPIIDVGPAFRAAAKPDAPPYRDNIHPNALGQQVLADALMPPIQSTLETRLLAE